MRIETNCREHLADFVRLNELWITEHFQLEAADRELAASPGAIIDRGGFVFSLVDAGQVAGVCALFKDADERYRYQLARMAVAPACRGRGFGRALMTHAIAHARAVGATSLYLLFNTVLAPAIALYESFGFEATARGQHPVYARCNIVMGRRLEVTP